MQRKHLSFAAGVLVAWACVHAFTVGRTEPQTVGKNADAAIENGAALIEEGRHIFRYDTFGSEAFFGRDLRLHDAIKGAALGGVGPGISPATALELGLKVDVDALTPDVLAGLTAGTIDLHAPATTLALLQLDAVVGVKGVFTGDQLTAVGIRCALCHSTVDDSFAPGIGQRLDAWPNRDLDVGRIIAASPDLSPFAQLLGIPQDKVRRVLLSWGPGRFDAELFLDGKAFRPDGKTAATLIPAAFGLAGVNLHTYEGWGSVPHWNAFVANLEMHGKGTFSDARLEDAAKFPIAANAGFGKKHDDVDLITSKLPALQLYQLAIPVPAPPADFFDAGAAARGSAVFAGAGKCASCHVPPIFTDPGWNMHSAGEIGIDDFQAKRGPDGRYRTTPLRGLFTKTKGGFYHDGRFATLNDVVRHYDHALSLGLTGAQAADLVEYLKSL